MTAQLIREATSFHRRGLLWLAVLGLVCVGCGEATASRAWNDFGHMTVAAVAWEHLSPAARTQVDALLRLNPDYERWVEQVSPGRRAAIAFLRAATWPDAIKHEDGYQNDGERPHGPDSALNIGYEDRREHRYWHFIDEPFSPDGTPLPGVPAPNAATRIVDFRQRLADPKAPAAVRSYDLVWLVHLVGDIHQPLHAVSRFTRELPGGDLGGNLVRLCAPPCRQELHRFWDDALGEGSPAAALALAAKLPVPHRALVSDTRIADWVAESSRTARQVAYAAPIGDGTGPYRVNRAYRERARAVARERVALAGLRLAVLLNGALRRPPAAASGAAPPALPGSAPPP